MANVADLAHVSTQTVSRYFTGTGYVSERTRARIAAAIDELGYVPNHSARNLRTRRSDTVGVLSMGALNFGGASVLTGLGAAARAAEITLVIAQLDLDFAATGWEAEATRALDHFRSVQVDGIVVSTTIPGTDELIRARADDTPIYTLSELPGSSADAHSFAASARATQHLIDLGHRDILHIAGPSTRNEAVERERGYRETMVNAGLTPSVHSGATDWGPEIGAAAGRDADLDTFTAIAASNDEIALGFISASAQRRRHAPDDFSVIGIDDMPISAYFSPPLTTMRMNFEELGKTAFELLLQEIRTGEHTQHYTMEPELVIRASTGAPPTRPAPRR